MGGGSGVEDGAKAKKKAKKKKVKGKDEDEEGITAMLSPLKPVGT